VAMDLGRPVTMPAHDHFFRRFAPPMPEDNSAERLTRERPAADRPKQRRLAAIEQRAFADKPNCRHRPAPLRRQQRRHRLSTWAALNLHGMKKIEDGEFAGWDENSLTPGRKVAKSLFRSQTIMVGCDPHDKVSTRQSAAETGLKALIFERDL